MSKLTPVLDLSVSSIHEKPRFFDFGDNCDIWEFAFPDLDADEYEDNPVMNFIYPISEWDATQVRMQYEDRSRSGLPIVHLPLALVNIGGEMFLALTGGGMDFSWEICEAYMRLGMVPPIHFARQLEDHGRPTFSDRDHWIINGCHRSLRWERDSLQSTLVRLVQLKQKHKPTGLK